MRVGVRDAEYKLSKAMDKGELYYHRRVIILPSTGYGATKAVDKGQSRQNLMGNTLEAGQREVRVP